MMDETEDLLAAGFLDSLMTTRIFAFVCDS
jgi:hypothetical protein